MPKICYTLSLCTIARCSSLASVFQSTSIWLHSWGLSLFYLQEKQKMWISVVNASASGWTWSVCLFQEVILTCCVFSHVSWSVVRWTVLTRSSSWCKWQTAFVTDLFGLFDVENKYSNNLPILFHSFWGFFLNFCDYKNLLRFLQNFVGWYVWVSYKEPICL